MFYKKDLINTEDKLTAGLVFDKFLTGKIPSEVRMKNETAGAANRRRTLILNQLEKRGKNFKRELCEKIHAEALRQDKEFNQMKDFENSLNEKQLVCFNALSLPLKKVAVFLVKESRENRLTPDLKKLADLKKNIVETVKNVSRVIDPYIPTAEEIEKGKIAFV